MSELGALLSDFIFSLQAVKEDALFIAFHISNIVKPQTLSGG